ncbi:hypothetical protein ACFQAS_01655 [Halopenitus salinus]|uniref:Uncharacterized protein n=1 Tax=Halopenitus salinus TaxID=1198295 RepID=A0ABD5UXI4_9EURY
MSTELPDRFDRDLAAPSETAARARRARRRGVALNVEWEEAFEMYTARANRDPRRFVRFTRCDRSVTDPIITRRGVNNGSSDEMD